MRFWRKREPLVERIRVLDIGPEDCVVFQTKRALNQAQAAHIGQIAREALGHTRILLLDDGTDISLLHSRVDDLVEAFDAGRASR